MKPAEGIVSQTALCDVWHIKSARFSDDRGYFAEAFALSALRKKNILPPFSPLQINQSCSHLHVFRGFHYQRPPHAQSKIIQVLRGSICDMLVDLRQGSPTEGKSMTLTLCDTETTCLYIPKGIAHGFLTLSDNSLVQYIVDVPYVREAEGGIRYNQAGLNAAFPVSPVLSPKDDALGTLSQSLGIFSYDKGL